MNLVDILIWVVLLICAVKGFMKGLVREVCSLLGLIVGGWAAVVWCRPVAEVFQPHIPFSHTVTLLISFGLIFLALGLIFFLLGYLLTTLLKIVFLSSLNRIGGVLLGILQGALVLCVLLVLGTSGPVPPKVRSYVEKSASARPFLACGRELLSWWHFGSGTRGTSGADISSRSVHPGFFSGAGRSR